jgi:hypothetical protein
MRFPTAAFVVKINLILLPQSVFREGLTEVRTVSWLSIGSLNDMLDSVCSSDGLFI